LQYCLHSIFFYYLALLSELMPSAVVGMLTWRPTCREACVAAAASYRRKGWWISYELKPAWRDSRYRTLRSWLNGCLIHILGLPKIHWFVNRLHLLTCYYCDFTLCSGNVFSNIQLLDDQKCIITLKTESPQVFWRGTVVDVIKGKNE
jgi:hypothetical protein